MVYLAVLITVHNRRDLTIRCLDNLYSLVIPDDVRISVYLTDDGCTDGTREAVSERFPEVNIIHGDGSLYWSGGMRMAWIAAVAQRDYDYYFWLNDDTFLYDYTLIDLLGTSRDNDDKAIIVGPTQNSAHNKTTYGVTTDNGKRIDPAGKAILGETFNGNIVLIPRSVYHIIGNLDEHFIHSGGDTDYGWTARERGIPIIQTGRYLGECEEHPRMSKWCDPEIPFRERKKALNSPTGVPLKILYYCFKKHFGFFRGVRTVLSTMLHCALPKLYERKEKRRR